MSKTTVHLRIYKGSEILLKGDGKTVNNENQLLKLTYNDLAWKKHLKNLPKMGLCKVEIAAVYDGETQVEASEELKNEIESVLKAPETELSAEQKRIKALEESNAELSAKLDRLLSDKDAKPTKEPKEPVKGVDTELEGLKAEYIEKFDRKVPNLKAGDKEWIKAELAK